MASIPRKSVKGANLKKWLVETIDGILDYLHSSRVRPGYGIAVDETPSGTIVRLAGTPSGNAPISTGGGGTGVSGGLGIVVSGGTGGNPYLVNANLQGGTDISITGGSGGNPLVISYTGGGGGGGGTFYSPNYGSLSVGGVAPQYGLGHTFVLPVKAGNVGFYDDGGGAVGVWTDITGASTHALTNRTLYPAPSDGWIRVSVIDGGTASGACLRIQDTTGSMPIYKYGSFGGAGSGLNAPDWRNIASGTTPEGNTVIELTKNGTATTTSTAGFIYAYAEFTYGAAYPAYASAHVVVNGGTFKVCSLAMTDYPNGDTPVRMGAGITIPVISGAEVRFIVSTTDYNGNPDNSAFITNAGCVLYQNLS